MKFLTVYSPLVVAMEKRISPFLELQQTYTFYYFILRLGKESDVRGLPLASVCPNFSSCTGTMLCLTPESSNRRHS